MVRIRRIVSAVPVTHGVLKLVWDDGFEGIVDLRPVIAKGRVFKYLQTPKHFAALRIGEYGHSIYWTNKKGEQIDFGSDGLRATAEKQAALHSLAS